MLYRVWGKCIPNILTERVQFVTSRLTHGEGWLFAEANNRASPLPSLHNGLRLMLEKSSLLVISYYCNYHYSRLDKRIHTVMKINNNVRSFDI